MVTKDFADSNTPKIVAAQDNLPNTLAAPIATISTSTPATIASTTIVASTTPVVKPVTKTVVNNPTGVNSASTNTVTLTDSGFSPAKITVSMGDSVTFVNNSSSKMWVAANPFPTSSDYPAFNEKSGVDSGGSWTFTFDQAGTWFYHNHYSPPTGAKVVVSWKQP